MRRIAIATWLIPAAVTVLAAGCVSSHTTRAAATTPGQTVVVTSPSAAPATVVPGQIHHTIVGTVDDVNHSSGKVKLRTADGKVELRLPPDAVAPVHEGDSATIDVVIGPVR